MSSSTKVATGSIAGIIVGLLVMKGYVSPADANAVSQNLEVLGGAILTIVSLIGFFAHHVQKPNTTTPVTPVEPVTPAEPNLPIDNGVQAVQP